MSGEYISRETAIKSTWMILVGMGYPKSENGSLGRTVESVFKSAPAADVVEVVRCGECKHYRSWGRVYERKDYTGLCTEWSNMSVHKTEFCSRSIRKRKDGGQGE